MSDFTRVNKKINHNKYSCRIVKLQSAFGNKRQRIPKGKSEMDNPEKLTTQVTQDENKNTTQYVLYTTMRKQTQIS